MIQTENMVNKGKIDAQFVPCKMAGRLRRATKFGGGLDHLTLGSLAFVFHALGVGLERIFELYISK